MNQRYIDCMTEVAIAADEQDDYGGFVVYGCRDALLGKPEPAFTDGTPQSCDSQQAAWRIGYGIGQKHREALS